MAETWDYAKLSKMAKEAGGPELLVEKIYNDGKMEGRYEMMPWLVVAGLAGQAILLIGQKMHQCTMKKRKLSKEQAELAKQQLIQNINNYDMEQCEVEQVAMI